MKKWISVGKYGLRYREHETETVGVGRSKRPRRYYQVLYKWKNEDGKPTTLTDSYGWEGFDFHNEEEIIRTVIMLRQNRRNKTPPFTLAEMNKQKEDKLKAEKEALVRDEEDRVSRERLKFGNLFQEYINLQPATRTTRETRAFYKKWLEGDLAEKHLSEIKLLDLERIKRRMEKAGRAPRTVKTIKETIRPVYNYAIKHGIYEGKRPTDNFLDKQRIDNKRLEYYTPEQATKLLEELKTKSVQTYRMALLSLNTGMRFGEIAHLRWLHVNVDRETILVMDPKNKESRASFMTPDVKAMFQEMVHGEPEDLVFPDNNGQIQGKISNTFPRVVKELGFNEGVTDRRFNLGFHSLRHTAASWLAEQGVPLVVIAKVLGHKTLEMTMRYTKVNDDQVRDAVKALGRAGKSKRKTQKVLKIR